MQTQTNKTKRASGAPEAPQDISEAYDIKNVDFRNLLTVAVGTLSNQTGESFDSALSRGKCADEILRRYNEQKAHAERLAEALGNVRMALTLDFTGKHKHGGLCEQYPELEKFRRMASEALAAWEGVK